MCAHILCLLSHTILCLHTFPATVANMQSTSARVLKWISSAVNEEDPNTTDGRLRNILNLLSNQCTS